MKEAILEDIPWTDEMIEAAANFFASVAMSRAKKIIARRNRINQNYHKKDLTK